MAKIQKRRDKIFNNSYNNGTNIKSDFTSTGDIKIDKAEIGGNLSENEDFDSYTIYKYMEKKILLFIKDNDYFKDKFDITVKRKFNKEILNEIYKKLKELFVLNTNSIYAFNIIYLFDIVSSLTGIKPKTLFDFLNFEYKSELINELDKTMNILDLTNKMF